MDLELHGKVALVTGGASGIGEAIARALIAEGARVAIADRDGARGHSLAAEYDGQEPRVVFIAAELTEEVACRRAVEETVRLFGRLDILVNNAGVNDAVSLERKPEDFFASLRRNIFPVFAITRFALDALRQSCGAIVNISSKVAVTGQGHTSGYAAAKGGVNALTREWAVALANDGIRVNTVAPAECATPGYEDWFRAQPDPAAARRRIEERVPLGKRMTTPEEVAAAVVFLASPRSSHTTGQIVFVDGGYTHLDRAATSGGPPWT